MRSIARSATSGLAGADLALEQAVHRVRLGEVVLDLGADLALAAGQLERQPLVERRQQLTLAAGPRLGAERRSSRAAPGQHQLGDQRLLEAEPQLGLAAPGRSRPARGSSRTPCARRSASTVSRSRVRQQVGDVVEDGAREADRPLEVPGLDALGERVDRVERAQAVERGLRRTRRPRRRRRTSPSAGLVSCHWLAEPRDLAGEHAALAAGEPLGVPVGHVLLLGEERHLQRRAVGAQHGLDPVGATAGAAVGVGLGLGAGDLADDGELLAGLEARRPRSARRS